jgi:signal transduction histidine kinase
VDSLLTLLKQEKDPIAKTLLYNKISQEIYGINGQRYFSAGDHDYFMEAHAYADSGLQLAGDVSFHEGEIELNRTVGDLYLYEENYDEAIRYYTISYETAFRYGTDYQKALALYNLGMIHSRLEKPVQALEYINLALSLYQGDDHDKSWQLDVYRIISEIYEKANEYRLSVEYGNAALDMAKRANDTANIAIISMTLANAYLPLNKIDTAAYLYETAIEYFHATGNFNNKALALRKYASEIIRSRDPAKSLEMLLEAAQLYEQSNPKSPDLADTYRQISEIHRQTGNKDNMEYYRSKALQKALLSGHPSVITNIYVWLGTEALKTMRQDRAERYFLSAERYNSMTGSVADKITILNYLSEIYKRKGNARKMFEIAQEAVRLHDSLTTVEDQRHLDLLNIQYELKELSEKKEMELRMTAEQQQRRIRQRNLIIILSSAALVILFILQLKLVRNSRNVKKKNIMLEETHKKMMFVQNQLRTANGELNLYRQDLEKMVRQKADEQAQKDMQLYGLSNNIPGGFIYRKTVDKHGHEQLLYISSNIWKLYGVFADDLTGKGDFFSFLGEEFVAALKRKEAGINGKKEQFRYESAVVLNDRTIWLLVCAFPNSGSDETVIWDGLVIDITRQKESEQILKAAKERAEEADRLKSVFLANMSHEIRTPMNAILGFIYFLENENLAPEKRKKYIETIQKSAEQLLKLVENIIDISKLEVRQIKMFPTEFALNELMRELEEAFAGEIPAGKALFVQFDDTRASQDDVIYTDRMRLKQILQNLLENAIKYTDKGYVRFGYKHTNTDMLQFFVEDTGIGIPDDQQNVIFEYFRQGDYAELMPKYGGTGLGLSISKGLTECLGGKIYLESEQNQGSTFYFTIKKRLE